MQTRTAVLVNSNKHATVNIVRFTWRVDRCDNRVRIVPPNINSEKPCSKNVQYPFLRGLSSEGLTIQEGLQQHREELCLVQRDATGTHISGCAPVGHLSKRVCLR